MTTSNDVLDISDKGIEAFYAGKLDAGPRVTVNDITDSIDSIIYFTALDGIKDPVLLESMSESFKTKLSMHLFCIITIKGGFSVTGENACVSPKNYIPAMARQMAYQMAIDKLWPMFGFELSRKLHKEKTA